MKWKKASKLTTILIIALICYASYLIFTVSEQIESKETEIRQLENQIMKEKEKIAELNEEIASMGTDAWIKKIARERLGLVEANEIIYEITR